ncbi:MAG TPA: succinylglutamate desuccinylase/aspartoacylase family protein [Cellvibrionaceae bacterium]|nr:succinylglutamate desuccinylase/aspartoacylase family protein [Cellvibrionaceae bacterium]HMW47021.1 succinylglutamate desuccinylase/aspartoacylase family protein [Cellvibrionaceae bacterium]HMW72232.1 succinylglutamate desuccinylase/aspartoacylase family protein [Cellvibrionaceae bacterium]HNG58788.1 succinylglutamate desuccinylase/aspartoacylase family protein [Cellvibrionaceae bacterium]
MSPQPHNLHFKSISYQALKPGRKLIILGAVHGNEVCGTQAITRIMAEIDRGDIILRQGKVTFVPITNPLAYAKNERSGDRNLNRNLFPSENPQDFEDHIANWLCPLLAEHEILLDLHSFHTPGLPMVMMGPENNSGTLEAFKFAEEENALAVRLGVNRFVDGWLDTYAKGVERRQQLNIHPQDRQHLLNTDVRYGVGTTEYMREQGGYALTLECGQHADPKAQDIGYQAIINTLVYLGFIDGDEPVPVAEKQSLRLYEVIDRNDPADQFIQEWKSFDEIKAGAPVGRRADGTLVCAESDGFIVFPNPKAQPGQEWFYLARPTDRLSD